MKKLLLFTLVCSSFLSLNPLQAQEEISLANPDVTLKFRQAGGSNASAVVFDPEHQLYYAVIAGSGSYPLEAFDLEGVPRKVGTAIRDLRGLWYNPQTKTVEGNTFDAGGLVAFSDGFKDVKVLIEGQHQPHEQCVGTYAPSDNFVLYYVEGKVHCYSRKTGQEENVITLDLAAAKVTTDDLSPYTLLYTNKRGMEYGVVDVSKGRALFFNKKGQFKYFVYLPETSELYDAFNVSFANGRIWLYNKSNRTWTGFLVVE